MKIKYGTQTIEFSLQRGQNIKHTYISVDRDSGVVVKAPMNISENEIEILVKSKAKWIVQKLDDIGCEINYGEIVTGSRLFYLGKSYYVELIKDNTEIIKIVFIHSKFKIYATKDYNQQELNVAIDKFYKQKAKEKITKLVQKFSDIMKLYPEYVGFRKSKNKWASCSPRNRLTFNPELIKLSSTLIEYTVIHELAHIAHKNHSKEFWKLVKKFMSDYTKQEKKLREFEKKL